MEDNTKQQLDLIKLLKKEKDPAKQKIIADKLGLLANQGEQGRQANDTTGNPFLSDEKVQQYHTNPLGAVIDQARQSAALPFYATPVGGFKSGAVSGAMLTQANSNNPTEIAGGALAGGALAKLLPFLASKFGGAGQPVEAAGNQGIVNATNIVKGGGSKSYISRTASGAPEQNQVLLDEGILFKPTETGRIKATQTALNKYGEQIASTVEGSDATITNKVLKQTLVSKLSEAGYDIRMTAQGNLAGDKAVISVINRAGQLGEFNLASGENNIAMKTIWNTAQKLEKYGAKSMSVPLSGPYTNQVAEDTARILRGELSNNVPDVVSLNQKYSALKDYHKEILPNTTSGADVKGGLFHTGAAVVKNTANPILNLAYNASKPKVEVNPLLNQILGKSGALVGGAVNPGANQLNTEANQQESGNNLPQSDNQSNQSDNSISQQSNYLTGHSPEEIYKAIGKAQAAGDKTAVSQLRTMFKDETDYQATQKKDVALSAAQQTRHDNLQAAIASLDSAVTNLTASGGAKGPGNLATVPILGQLIDPEGHSYYNTKIELATQLAKAITNSSRPGQDVIDKYMHSLPDVNDTPQYANAKVKKLRNELLQQAKSFKFSDLLE